LDFPHLPLYQRKKQKSYNTTKVSLLLKVNTSQYGLRNVPAKDIKSSKDDSIVFEISNDSIVLENFAKSK
jgi:hypothetical protein